MAMITGFGLFVVAVLTAALARVLAEEISAWSPSLVRRLIKLAVRRLPESKRERFEEEWESHVNEVPGLLGKFFVAAGFVVAAYDIAWSNRRERALADLLQEIDSVRAAMVTSVNLLRANEALLSLEGMRSKVERLESHLRNSLELRDQVAAAVEQLRVMPSANFAMNAYCAWRCNAILRRYREQDSTKQLKKASTGLVGSIEVWKRRSPLPTCTQTSRPA
jgi:hypothetical protein